MAVNEHDASNAGADDTRLAALYRSAAVEEPPERLDRLIRDVARAPLRAAPPAARRPWWQAWRAPFAFAAVAVLSVSVVIVAQREGGEPLTIQAPAPSAAPPDAEPPVHTPPAPRVQGDVPAGPREPASQTAKSQSPAADAARGAAAEALPAPVARDEAAQDPRSSSDESRLRSATPAAAATPMELPRRRRDTDAAPTLGVRGLEGEIGEQRREKAAERVPERLESERPFAAAPPPPAPASAAPTGVEAKPASAPPPPPAPAPSVEAKPAPSMPRAKPESAPAAKALARPPAAAGAASSAAPAAKREALTAALADLMRDLEGRPPAQWVDRIVLLRAQGRRDDADALLAEFKRRYPDDPLPVPLQ